MLKHTIMFVAVVGLVLALAPAAQAEVTMDWVPIGPPTTVDDTEGDDYGAVDYNYNIGTYEVTNTQYAKFLTAVDPAGTNHYGLHNGNMDITLSGSTWSANVGYGQRPVVYVNWGDAVRFANWMTNGQQTGQLDGTQPHDDGLTEDGSYDLDGATTDAALLAVAVPSPDIA